MEDNFKGYIFASVSSEGDTEKRNILLLTKHLYITIRANPSLGADCFYPHTEFIRLRSPLVGGGKTVTKGSSITVGGINPGA